MQVSAELAAAAILMTFASERPVISSGFGRSTVFADGRIAALPAQAHMNSPIAGIVATRALLTVPAALAARAMIGAASLRAGADIRPVLRRELTPAVFTACATRRTWRALIDSRWHLDSLSVLGLAPDALAIRLSGGGHPVAGVLPPVVAAVERPARPFFEDCPVVGAGSRGLAVPILPLGGVLLADVEELLPADDCSPPAAASRACSAAWIGAAPGPTSRTPSGRPAGAGTSSPT